MLLASFKTYFQSRTPIRSSHILLISIYNTIFLHSLNILKQIQYGPPEISFIIEFYLEFLNILSVASLKYFPFACRTQFSYISYIFKLKLYLARLKYQLIFKFCLEFLTHGQWPASNIFCFHSEYNFLVYPTLLRTNSIWPAWNIG